MADPVITGIVTAASAIYAVGQLKALAVGVLKVLSGPSNVSTRDIDEMEMEVYGQNFTSLDRLKRSIPFVFPWGPEQDIGAVSKVNHAIKSGGILLSKMDYPRLSRGGVKQSVQSDVNIQELVYTKFMLEKSKESFTRFIPCGPRERPAVGSSSGRDRCELLTHHIWDRISRDVSPSMLKNLKDNFDIEYARKMSTEPASFGYCLRHCKSNRLVFWTANPEGASSVDRCALIEKHIENSMLA